MSKSARMLDRIAVTSPCDADWESMIGNDRVRFCEHCQLPVNNLSSMTRREAMRLVEQSGGRLCVRYVQRANGEVLTKPVAQKLHRISRRVSRLAAGAFSATLSVAGAAAQNSIADNRLIAPSRVASVLAPANSGASIAGVIKDPNGAVIPGATVTLIDPKDHSSFVFVTADDGAYNFSLLEAGLYSLTVDAQGFSAAKHEAVNLGPAVNRKLDVDMTVEMVRAEVEVRSEVLVAMSVQGGIGLREPSDPLIKAAFKDDLSGVKDLIPLTDDINKWDPTVNVSALSAAIDNHNLEMVDLLLSVGASATNANRHGKSSLLFLNNGATVELVRRLIIAGADVNARDNEGVSVLHNAASLCDVAVVKELLSYGARADAKDNSENTVLLRAAVNHDADVIKLLIVAGADIYAKNKAGESALSLAADTGGSKTLKAIIDAGGALNLKQNELDQVLLDSADTADPVVVKLLIDAGANPNAKDEDGSTPLIEAARRGKPETLKILIAAGADVNARDDDGTTALMETDDLEMTRVLLNAGADTALKNHEGRTALSLAIENKEEEIVNLLRSRGAPK